MGTNETYAAPSALPATPTADTTKETTPRVSACAGATALGDWLPASDAIDKVRVDTPIAFTVDSVHVGPGDRLKLTAMRGDRPTCTEGGTFEIEGSYTLQSSGTALLAASISNGMTCGRPGPRGQRLDVARGSGSFVLRFEMVRAGAMHVSFFPSGGGSSAGDLYFSCR